MGTASPAADPWRTCQRGTVSAGYQDLQPRDLLPALRRWITRQKGRQLFAKELFCELLGPAAACSPPPALQQPCSARKARGPAADLLPIICRSQPDASRRGSLVICIYYISGLVYHYTTIPILLLDNSPPGYYIICRTRAPYYIYPYMLLDNSPPARLQPVRFRICWRVICQPCPPSPWICSGVPWISCSRGPAGSGPAPRQPQPDRPRRHKKVLPPAEKPLTTRPRYDILEVAKKAPRRLPPSGTRPTK